MRRSLASLPTCLSHALVDLKVDPPMMSKGLEVIFGNKFFRDDQELYFNILRAVEWGAEIEV